MKLLSMSIAASLITALAGIASARDVQPSTTDEARAASLRRTDGSPSEPGIACGRMPTTTDEARALGGGRLAGASAVASRVETGHRASRTPTTTDEVRALASAAPNGRVVVSTGGHGDACGRSCACVKPEEHASSTAKPCACHGRS